MRTIPSGADYSSWMVFRIAIMTAVLSSPVLRAQAPDPAYSALERAYTGLKARDYDAAVASFQEAIRVAPNRAAPRKDLAYTLLKIGRNEEARDQFAEAVRIDPTDHHAALEYAFLCNETKHQAQARRVFDRIRREGDPASRATAETAFHNIDDALAEGIAWWKRALEMSPDNFSAHEELARIAEQRDEVALAAEQYEKAWKLRPGERRFLLDLGRTWKALGRIEDANAVLLAASRGAQPSVAEAARGLLPRRYPYVYEFQNALKYDPDNLVLRRELAYLLLEMGKKDEALIEFDRIAAAAPYDLLSAAQAGFLHLARGEKDVAMPLLDRVLKGPDEELADRARAALQLPRVLKSRPEGTTREQRSIEAKELAAKSLEKGYLQDALKYLNVAHEYDPVDFDVIRKLGWTYNILKQDREAVKWFALARKSPDPAIAAEAATAYRNLSPQFARFRTSVWAFPYFSTRWHDLFAYAQAKTEMRIKRLPLRPYVSLRFVGDVRGEGGAGGGVIPQNLSESAIIAAAGLATSSWHGVHGWFEAGESIRYLGRSATSAFMVPDYRGGASFGKGFGRQLAGSGRGRFAQTAVDGVFVSRFDNDTIFYAQNLAGYTFAPFENGIQIQAYWNGNLTTDVKRQYWANFVETGPGLRIRLPWLNAGMRLSIDALRGAYLVNQGNPRGPNFNDLRIGLWYAFTR